MILNGDEKIIVGVELDVYGGSNSLCVKQHAKKFVDLEFKILEEAKKLYKSKNNNSIYNKIENYFYEWTQ